MSQSLVLVVDTSLIDYNCLISATWKTNASKRNRLKAGDRNDNLYLTAAAHSPKHCPTTADWLQLSARLAFPRENRRHTLHFVGFEWTCCSSTSFANPTVQCLRKRRGPIMQELGLSSSYTVASWTHICLEARSCQSTRQAISPRTIHV